MEGRAMAKELLPDALWERDDVLAEASGLLLN
jgi:hypothetical protein